MNNPQFSVMTFRMLALAALLFLVGCQTMGPTEHAVRFRKLPPVLLGGVGNAVIPPGKTVIVMPGIDSIYRFTTSVQDISWGIGRGEDGNNSYVYTRARDGNEVALALTILYQIQPDDARLVRLVQEVATSDQEVRELVGSIAGSEIRTFMNELRTSEFLDKDARYRAVDGVGRALNERLNPFGIEIVRVNLDDFRFERRITDGEAESVDTSYQDKLREIQRLKENTEREQERVKTVTAKKLQEQNEMQAQVNRWLQEAEGYKKQAQLRGNGYLQTKQNEASSILAEGRAFVDGLRAQVAALSGQGGIGVLKLELARRLAEAQSRFIVMGESAQSLDVKRTDTNDLIRQLGLVEAMKDKAPAEAPASAVTATPQPTPESNSLP